MTMFNSWVDIWRHMAWGTSFRLSGFWITEYDYVCKADTLSRSLSGISWHGNTVLDKDRCVDI